jgi:hypothetical protein
VNIAKLPELLRRKDRPQNDCVGDTRSRPACRGSRYFLTGAMSPLIVRICLRPIEIIDAKGCRGTRGHGAPVRSFSVSAKFGKSI